MHYSELEIASFIEGFKPLFEHEAENKGLSFSLSVELPDGNKKLKTDASLLTIIVKNLMANAIKFTPKGLVVLGNYIHDGKVVFYVRDTGVGIPAERLEAIFDRFVLADLKLSNPFEGSGLGLSIVKSYVELLDGKIWVESEEGKGSTFYVSLSC